MSAQYDGRRASEDVSPAVPQGRASWYGVPPGQRRDSFVEPPLHGRGAQEEYALVFSVPSHRLSVTFLFATLTLGPQSPSLDGRVGHPRLHLRAPQRCTVPRAAAHRCARAGDVPFALRVHGTLSAPAGGSGGAHTGRAGPAGPRAPHGSVCRPAAERSVSQPDSSHGTPRWHSSAADLLQPRRSFDFEHMQPPYDRRVSDPLPVHVRLCIVAAICWC